MNGGPISTTLTDRGIGSGARLCALASRHSSSGSSMRIERLLTAFLTASPAGQARGTPSAPWAPGRNRAGELPPRRPPRALEPAQFPDRRVHTVLERAALRADLLLCRIGEGRELLRGERLTLGGGRDRPPRRRAEHGELLGAGGLLEATDFLVMAPRELLQ